MTQVPKKKKRRKTKTKTPVFKRYVPKDKDVVIPDKFKRVGNKEFNAVVIFLHGLGDEPKGAWSYEFQKISKQYPYIKFILPCANENPVSMNGGYKMTSWHDIKTLTDLPKNKFLGKDKSFEKIIHIAETEIKNVKHPIKPERILLVGFSQGGAMALYTLLHSNYQFAGAVVISGYLCDWDIKKTMKKSDSNPSKNKDLDVLMLHAKGDDVVELKWGELTKKTLEEAGCSNITLQTYDIDSHTTNEQEMGDFVTFMAKKLPKIES